MTSAATLSERVIVVLPAYNEAENLGTLLDSIAKAMHNEQLTYEVVVVDDGSGDRTIEVAEAYAASMPIHLEKHEVNQGLGATIRDGLLTAVERSGPHDIIVAMDADNTQPPGLIGSMVRCIREGNDVVIASRYQPGARVLGVPLSRRFLSWGAGMVFRCLFPVPSVKDYTCGFRAYRASVLKAASEHYGENFFSEAGFQCMVDILLKLHLMKAICREVPMVLRYDWKKGASKMKVANTVVQTIALLLKRRFKRCY